jgi:hypothetical protein
MQNRIVVPVQLLTQLVTSTQTYAAICIMDIIADEVN